MTPQIPILDYDRLSPLESEMDAEPVVTQDKIADAFAAAYGKARPGAAGGFGEIITMILKVLELVGGCPFARARQAIKDGDSTMLAAGMRAGIETGMSPAEAVRFTLELREQAKAATDAEIDSFLAAAPAFATRQS